jgi:uncharacterized protein (UPF0261 family)/ABC-type branched-subunit amino acid transport system ATPase component
MTPLLEIERLNVHYGRAHALQDVSLQLEHGVIAVVGRNGMGKTTLCNAVTGLVRATGSVRFLGQELIGLPPNRITRLGIGYVPQGRRVWPSLTVHEHLLLSKNSNKNSLWTIERIYATFPRLAERKSNGGAELSGGEQQMLAISRALLLNPRLLVMDEPTEGLAPVIVQQVEAMLKSLADGGEISVLLIEQNLGVAIAVADTVDVMVNGRIARSLPAAELAGDLGLQQRLLGVKAADDEEIVEAAPAAESEAVQILTVKRAGAAEVPAPIPSDRTVRSYTRWGSAEIDRPIEAEEQAAPAKPETRVVEFPVAASTGRAAYVVGTFDTKARELGYLRGCLEKLGLRVVTVDIATSGRPSSASVSSREVARCHPQGERAVFTGDRGSAVAGMALALEHFIVRRRDLGGMISAGGSGNTALATQAMRRLPVGVPKVMVSTVASGDVKPYVGPSDICMMYSVTDVSGINRISERVLANAAHALAGMISYLKPERNAVQTRPAIGLTMFGLTTPCVQALTPLLETEHDCIVFHATGTGGQSMEKLVESGLISAVIDVTTTEIADEIAGGVLSAGPERMDVFARLRVPYVGSCGALDMVNFWAMDTVPAHYKGRRLHSHNPNVTLMRTAPEENVKIGRFIAAKLNRMNGPVRFLIPEGGVSGLDQPGGPFWDPAADKALFDAISADFISSPQKKLIRLPQHINDPAFAAALAAQFREIMPKEARNPWPASRATAS